jgi:AcrR family transcriptional regulator
VTTDQKIQAAYDTLTAGRPRASDGQLTVSGICAEAGISRASFYRSPLAARIRADLADPASTRRPEAEQLRAKVRELTVADKELRSKHAAEIRDLRATVRTYANQIQILTLRIGQLEDDNKQLTARLHHAGDNVTPLNRPLPVTRQPVTSRS